MYTPNYDDPSVPGSAPTPVAEPQAAGRSGELRQAAPRGAALRRVSGVAHQKAHQRPNEKPGPEISQRDRAFMAPPGGLEPPTHGLGNHVFLRRFLNDSGHLRNSGGPLYSAQAGVYSAQRCPGASLTRLPPGRPPTSRPGRRGPRASRPAPSEGAVIRPDECAVGGCSTSAPRTVILTRGVRWKRAAKAERDRCV